MTSSKVINPKNSPGAKLLIDRDSTIDCLRGFAIFTMVAANAEGYVLSDPHPLWFPGSVVRRGAIHRARRAGCTGAMNPPLST